MPEGPDARDDRLAEEPFGELLAYTASGFVGGMFAAGVLDGLGLQRSGLGKWLVRTLAGEGESLLEGLLALRRRQRGAAGSLAEAYGWGKVLGMAAPWLIDVASRLAGVDVYGVSGFYIPYFYTMSDQIGASLAGLFYLRRRRGSWSAASAQYVRNPVMLTSLTIVLLVLAGLLGARVAGFSPTNQIYTAAEAICANLGWLPPLAGWLKQRGAAEPR